MPERFCPLCRGEPELDNTFGNHYIECCVCDLKYWVTSTFHSRLGAEDPGQEERDRLAALVRADTGIGTRERALEMRDLAG